MTRRQIRWWVLLCLISVVGFQSLGHLHRTLHGGALPAQVRMAMAAAVASDEASPSSSHSLQFGHAAGSADCQLLDQLSDSLGPTSVQALAWTALLPDTPVSAPQPHSAPLAQVWRKTARGPPVA